MAVLFAWTMTWVWVPYIFGHPYNASGAAVLGGFLLFGLFFFLLNTLNLKTVMEKLEEKVHEAAVDRLNAVLASLVQTNTNVASVNLLQDSRNRSFDGIASESLLQRMDDALQVKGRLKSIESVIKARQLHVVDGAKHIQEHRDRVGAVSPRQAAACSWDFLPTRWESR